MVILNFLSIFIRNVWPFLTLHETPWHLWGSAEISDTKTIFFRGCTKLILKGLGMLPIPTEIDGGNYNSLTLIFNGGCFMKPTQKWYFWPFLWSKIAFLVNFAQICQNNMKIWTVDITLFVFVKSQNCKIAKSQSQSQSQYNESNA